VFAQRLTAGLWRMVVHLSGWFIRARLIQFGSLQVDVCVWAFTSGNVCPSGFVGQKAFVPGAYHRGFDWDTFMSVIVQNLSKVRQSAFKLSRFN